MPNTWSLVLLSLLCAGLSACGGLSSGGAQAGGGMAGVGAGGGAPTSGSTGGGVQADGGNNLAAGGAMKMASSAGGGSAAAGNLPALTLHLAGDSTVSNYPSTTVQEGWGMEIGQFFNDRVTIDNKAIGGANVQTFKSGNWPRLIAALKPGDYVMTQFGANDSGTAHGPVTPAAFAAALEQMADEVQARGATPIFVTPSAFFQWSGGKEDNTRLAPYAAACYTAGAARNVLVDDLNARGVEWLNTIGQTAAADFYLPVRGAPDKAHFVKSGAAKMAQMVAGELRRIKSPLAAYLK